LNVFSLIYLESFVKQKLKNIVNYVYSRTPQVHETLPE